ncbi:MAG: extracellular solute-binding protein [Geminocystis sp.]|nr:VWA domain-containing protein [Geminocystis sp.]MDW8462397.1 extracellular solute-binding protein [Geminocystis sp.]
MQYWRGKRKRPIIAAVSSLLLLTGCLGLGIGQTGNQGIEIKFLAGSDLGEFCRRIAEKLNSSKPKLDNGQRFYLTCDVRGSGDVVNEVINLSKKLADGTISPQSPQFPSIISVDGEIYYSQLIYQINKIFPGKNYIPPIADSPLIAYSPMVFMTTKELAPLWEKQPNIFVALASYENYQQMEKQAPPIPIYFAQTAPTRSNSGLQTLVAQFAAVANKPPQDLTIADVKKYQEEVKRIQSKVTRYGVSTATLAQSMVENGIFWASIASVYESMVIRANSDKLSSQTTQYQAIYPKATFNSHMRAIIPNGPWMSEEEKEAAQEVVEYMLKPESQKLAAELGLRPGVPGITLADKFNPQYGVQSSPVFDSLQPPPPEVVEAMLESWRQYAKKPSRVAVVVDVSGSMQGQKIAAVKETLFRYINNLGPKEEIVIIPFDDRIHQPVLVKGTPESKNKGIAYISSLKAHGGTSLYDSALFARNWLRQNVKPNAINAVVILSDGDDTTSKITLEELEKQLQQSGFNSDERIAFFTIGYGKEGEFNPQVLERIAKLNGGYYRHGRPETIQELMANIQLEF